MEFEWDDEKSAATLKERGFGFDAVAAAFCDPHRMEFEDVRFEYGESRWTMFGMIEGRLFAVSYTFRGDVIRIISARKANERERRKYHGNQEIQP